jgi:hypothetical protein
MKVDNFALTIHQACPTKHKHRIQEHWTLRRKSPALGFGGALHLGIAEWYRRGSLDLAIQAIRDGWTEPNRTDDFRTMQKCIDVMRGYAKQYPNESFQIVGGLDPILEASFTIDTGLTTDAGTPIEYGGIFDGLVEFSGHVYILEHKSTSVLGPTYFSQFKPNNQVTGYIWAARQMTGMRVAGAMINAIGVYKAGATRFERHLTTRTDAEIDEWLKSVQSTCNEIEYHDRKGFWPMRTTSCTQYGLCEFHSVCSLADPTLRAKRLEQDFVREIWDYENRDGK